MRVIFTKHAEDKFDILQRHGLVITKEQVMDTVTNPQLLDHSRHPLLIAQGLLDPEHVLRVVYKRESEFIKIITFYPGRIKSYGK